MALRTMNKPLDNNVSTNWKDLVEGGQALVRWKLAWTCRTQTILRAWGFQWPNGKENEAALRDWKNQAIEGEYATNGVDGSITSLCPLRLKSRSLYRFE